LFSASSSRNPFTAVIGADGRAVRERQIVGPRRQSDIIDDQAAFVLRYDFPDFVFDLLEDKTPATDCFTNTD
jgi:hypothetical protein